MNFTEAVTGLMNGDFTRLAHLFKGAPGQIIEWYDAGLFADEPQALAEAFTCACFNAEVQAVEYFLSHGIDPNGGINTGMNALHWAANRGQLDAVEILLRHNAALETRNMYGGTVLGTTVWSAFNEPKPSHLQIIEALLKAGARTDTVDYPTGNQQIDELLQRYRA